MHLTSGRKESEVSYLNRRDRDLIADNVGYYARPDKQAVKKKHVLDPIGIKDINLKLIVPKTVILNLLN